ncbi:DUF4920 domain-containing protein [Pseudobacteriovorax antillogorgiicola]|uniref:DUF4920 domain-containing protein n=1 Tax=Pseudobacteriovorax antillogorgiicola TaxID=1513793 RepID=A0A1Y6BRM8_9BACT|nr:DUF4920 domain-containing protein [Pseudobacteriovorax antillogorgiicola]TCS54615.1 uncharacterized protein DUF4920 [Pseudobacteriovorax antillogorgiicola]SMF17444.1 protein of unknown function [Pseudobacteriovorax antillogorgiicola]
MRVLLSLCIILSSTCFAKDYGEALKPNLPKISLKKDEKLKNLNKPIELKGQVKKVCQKKGCWMVLDDGHDAIRITFKGYSFFVPMKLEGQTVRAQGILQKKVRTVGQQKHFLEDAGASQKEIDKIKDDKTVYEFVATGVKTENTI